MKYYLLTSVLSMLLVLSGFSQSAENIVAQCLEAHGGKAKIESLQTIKTSYLQHTYMIEQSERPEGPYLVMYELGKESIDFAKKRLNRQLKSLHIQSPNLDAPYSELRFDEGLLAQKYGERWFPNSFAATDVREYLAAHIGVALQQLANATSVTLAGQENIHGVENWRIHCVAGDANFTVFINRYTQLITALEYKSAYKPEDNFFWSFWGDYSTRLYFSSYNFISPGIYFPIQVDIVKNDWNFRTITYLDPALNAAVADSIFTIPNDVQQMAKSMATRSNGMLQFDPAANAVTVAENITMVKGAWNVTWVEQADGIVIIEAPIASDYSTQVIEYVRKTYPNKPIKAVISSSDAWPHLSGLRGYAAAKIPIYALNLNQPIIEKLLQSDFKSYPDLLAKEPQKSQINWVNQKVVLKDDNVPLEIIPIRGEGGERMQMVYFPKQKTLYAADLIQKNSRTGEFFWPGYLMEVKAAIAREKLVVKTIFAMHAEPLPWAEVEAVLAKIAKQ